ncbi:GNAT family N-acetyltransferase [Krasilnikovia sp. M28-CT-15]|uniref:GNAT family N-acetyltransferase n=1 Tax=Krasilnikovia sp. M28-CT-15 TaxID=3373540 RepID=UPI003877207D
MEFYRPAPLDTGKHIREGFNCGEPTLDEWLRRYAGQNRKGNTAATWVIADDQYRVVCYATLTMTSIDRSASPPLLAKGAPAQVPALLLGRLATDRTVARMGLGTQMVKHVLATAVELNHKAACRAVVVNALNIDAYNWWESFGFVPLDPQDGANLDLYLLTKDIEATLARL